MSVHRQELLHDGARLKVTLLPVRAGAGALRLGRASVPEEGLVLWFGFPGRPYEVAAAYGPDGEPLGWYTNIVRPPELAGSTWRIVDQFVDVWQDASGEAELLDLGELEEAQRRGWVQAAEAERAEAAARQVLEAARAGRWPPDPVRRWGPTSVPSLRFRRDAPGAWFANLISGRIIAWGMYTLGAVSLTSVAFAALTDAFHGSARSLTAWLTVIALEAAALLPFALAGRLPATRMPRPREAFSERILFIGTVVTSAAVFLLRDASEWRGGLLGLYAALGLFLLVFAVCRSVFDREIPVLALAGLLVCGVAFLFLA